MINSASNQLLFSSRKNFLSKDSILVGVQKEVQALFRHLFHMLQRFFSNVWSQTGDIGRIQLATKVAKSENASRKIDSQIYVGPGMQIEPKPGADPTVHRFMNYLLRGDQFPFQWLNGATLKAIFVRKDPFFLRSMKEEFQYVFEQAAKRLPLIGSKEEMLFETFIGNCIALLPYSYPEAGEVFSIPQKIEGEWRICQYRVDPIELTPKGILTPLKAFGLTSPNAPPLLTFLGTTYPAGDGFLASILSDFTPGLSVGHAPYLLGKTKIDSWLRGKTEVRLYGLSLGGALCFQVLRHHREKIEQANVYNPPGLFPWNWDKPFDREKVNIFCQENDLVSTMGFFPEGRGVSVYRVFGSRVENWFNAHVKCYTGTGQVSIAKSSVAVENNRTIRKILTLAHLIFGLVLGLLSIYCFTLLYLLARKIIVELTQYKSIAPF